ncbi:MAG: hypothetical protein A2029_10550 [Chloroflexi bacterium RBG_19FT_COMBO_47_9]|nr:MAG: hypothetical protein A2029_10550 [Chloroflexi bacterium RBG_19FT_COMBO_47_9]
MRIFQVNEGADITLQSLTLSDGSAGQGGGIYNQGTLIVSNSTVSSNHAGADGGGIYNDFGLLAVSESTITANDATNGGGIYNSLGTLTIWASTFSNNIAISYGAGIYNWGSMSITDSILSGNNAYYSGGGILNTGFGTLSIIMSTLSSNNAEEGGGISNWGLLGINYSTLSENTAEHFGGIQNGGTLTITNSILPGNNAIQGGAIGNDGTMSVTDCTLVGNNADDAGGGIINSGTMTITNSTLSENTTGINGGGINSWGKLTIINSTLSGNSAGGNGGGILADPGPFGNLKFINVTIEGNIATSGGGIYNNGPTNFKHTIIAYNTSENCGGSVSITSDGYNLDSGNSCEFSNTGDLINTNPLLGPLQNNGGHTFTYALLPGSPAIDAGDDAQCPPTDQRYVPRPLDGDGDGEAVCDIGSYEFEPEQLIVTTLEDELNSDGDCSLREAIQAANTNGEVDACGSGDPVITDTITFDVEGTISIISQLSITDGGPLVIDGAGAIAIDGGNSVRIFYTDTGADLTLRSLHLVDGYADAGGGIANNGTVVIIGSTLSGNTSTWGGGIANMGILTVTNSTFSGNNGDGILNNAGVLNISNSTFSDNHGSGIYNFVGEAVLSESTFSGNITSLGGGIYNNSTLYLTKSTIAGNNASQGGGIYNYGGSLIISNSTLSNNNADSIGGGIRNMATVTIYNSTLLGNNAIEDGGGVHNSWTLTAINTIIANNPTGGDCSSAIIDGGHNISSDDTCGFDPANGSMPNTDPLLSPLQDNGGPTWTHALLPQSPAIDSGDDAQCPATDQRGVPRPLDGDGDGWAVCDIGSYELEGQYVSPGMVNISGPSEALVGSLVNFTATVEPISTTLPLTYTWQVDSLLPITHTSGLTDTFGWACEVPGTYAITVTVSNIGGSVSDTHLITITDQPIEGLTAINDSPTLLGEATTFTATISSGTNVIFTWDFGDDSNGSGETITHTYIVHGVYTTTVTATNSVGSLTETTLVSITTPIYPIYLPLVIKSNNGILTPTQPSSLLGGGEWMGLVIVGIVGMRKSKG